MDPVQHRVEIGQAGGELAGLVGVGVEAVEADGRHLRATALAHEAGHRGAQLARGVLALALIGLNAGGGRAGHHRGRIGRGAGRGLAGHGGHGDLGHGLGGQAPGEGGSQDRVILVEVLQQGGQAGLAVHHTARRPGGDRRGAAQDQGGGGADGDGLHLALFAERADGAVQPAGGGPVDHGRATLKHVLGLEVGAGAVGRGDGGDDARLAGLGHGVSGG